MKKVLALAIALASACTLSATALAADTPTLTTTVPDATYTLNIPANQEIPFGETSTDIGNVTVTNSSGFAEGKNLEVTLNYDPFTAQNVGTTIPYKIVLTNESQSPTMDLLSGSACTFLGLTDGSVREEARIGLNSNFYGSQLNVEINSNDWGKTLAGEYSSTITFTAEVVVSQ